MSSSLECYLLNLKISLFCLDEKFNETRYSSPLGITMSSSLQSVSSNLASSINQPSQLVNHITEDSVASLTTVTESFSDLFTQLLSGTSEVETPVTDIIDVVESVPVTLGNVTDNLSTLQNGLLSNLLGYSSGISTSLDMPEQTSFSLDSIKESLQNALLGGLQANNVIAQTSVEEVPIEVGVLESISKFAFNDDGLGMEDVFDTLNIFQHVPIVSSIYQSVTEQDGLGAVSQLAGSLLFGGPASLAYSALDLAVESYSGTSITDAISNFDYANFILGGVSSDLDSSAITEVANTVNQTLFFDRDKNVIFER